MPSLYPNGLGGDVDELSVNAPFYGVDCVVWYVHAGTGTDASGSAGRERESPLATIAQAISNGSANDVIVCLDGHEETLTTALTPKRGQVIVGCGSTDGVPNVELSVNHASNGLMTVSVQNVQLRNLKILTNEQANSTARITVTGAGFVMDGCYVECDDNDNGTAVSLGSGADYATFVSTTFISTATTQAARPESALKTAAAVTGLRMHGCVFSDGSVGYSNGYACDLNGGAVTDGLLNSVSLLRGASMRLGSSFTGYVIPTTTGAATVDV